MRAFNLETFFSDVQRLVCSHDKVNIVLLFFLSQKRIFINFECINMRELFGIARMQTNQLNKLKEQTGGKWDAACLIFW